MDTFIYAVMHFAVDFLCAWSMFRFFREGSGGYFNLLIYNFCAFALQMPLGTLLDVLHRERMPKLWAVVGAFVTVIGAVVHPAVLGLGNALFHVGGGMDVIAEDFEKNHGGRNLGVFVAPGAVGLFLGTVIGKAGEGWMAPVIGTAVLIVLSAILLRRNEKHLYELPENSSGSLMLGLCCFAVVILRSFVGLSVTFSWKSGTLALIAVAAVALGKAAGGFLAAHFGVDRTIRVSLLLAAVSFLLGEHPVFGLAALLLFNMSMPVTLYLLARQLPRQPGFSFGLLTFGLFLGFLPVYGQLSLPISGGVLGAVGSVLSLLILAAGRKAVGEHASA